MISMLVQETEEGEKFVCFVSKVLKGGELRYPKIERLTLVLMIIARKLKFYF